MPIPSSTTTPSPSINRWKFQLDVSPWEKGARRDCTLTADDDDDDDNVDSVWNSPPPKQQRRGNGTRMSPPPPPPPLPLLLQRAVSLMEELHVAGEDCDLLTLSQQDEDLHEPLFLFPVPPY
jgi:hypothetical protein